jgi:predicted DCC family thiol-disulfide oxidoreductase YuxK
MTTGSASTPTSGSGRPLLIFDGDCGFCTTSARAAQRWLKLEHVEPWQFLDLDAIGVTEAACTAAVQWVAVDGTVSAGEKAASAALRHAGGVWGVLGRLMELPGIRHLAGVVYRLIARYRYKMPGGTPACRLPPG